MHAPSTPLARLTSRHLRQECEVLAEQDIRATCTSCEQWRDVRAYLAATLDVHRGYLASAAYGNRSDLKERKNDDYNLGAYFILWRYSHISRTAFSSIVTRYRAEYDPRSLSVA